MVGLLKLGLLAIASNGLCVSAFAQQASEAPIIYEPAFFERYAPQTALDMVERVPGFVLDQGENRRGLAGTAGNVLIDGRVPVVKGQGMRGFLRRIPASTVARVELIRGTGMSASNAQTVRVNIVRAPGGGSGVWRATLDYAEDSRISPNVDASWSSRIGRLEYRISGDYRTTHDPRPGSEVIFDATGQLDERTIEQRVRDDNRTGLSGEVKLPIGSGQFILVGSLDRDTEDVRESASVFSEAAELDGVELVHSTEERDSAELSATYTQALSGWDAELSALLLLDKADGEQTGVDLNAAGLQEESTLEQQVTEETEAILRAAASRGLRNGALTLEGEVAFNKLEQELRLFEDEGAGPVLVDLPGANTIVDELRGEFGASRVWELGPKWSLEAGLSYELSRLSNEGDFSDERDLSFWKPSLQITYRFGSQDQIRLRLYRDVGQLDFGDFAAGIELDNENIIAGNSELRPESSWRAELSTDWRFDEGALELTVYGWDVQDARDFAIFETATDRFDTRGNIGDGLVYGANARFETPLQAIPGSRLTLEAGWQETEVTDPLTGEKRQQSGAQRDRYALEFRQDIEAFDLAWGIEYGYETSAPEFRFDRVTETRNQDDVRLWLETTVFGDIKLQLRADNLFGSEQTRERTRFDPDRLGLIDRTERREREPGARLSFRVQGAF